MRLSIVIFCIVAGMLMLSIKFSPLCKHYFDLIFYIKDDKMVMENICNGYTFSDRLNKVFIKCTFDEIGFYEITIDDENERIPVGFKFNSVFQIDFIHEGEILYSEIVNDYVRAVYSQTNRSYYKSIVLHVFKIPFHLKKKKLEIIITVIEPDKNFEKYGETLKLCISPSRGI